MPIDVTLAAAAPDDAEVLGVPVFSGLEVPQGAGAELDLAYLRRRGYEARTAETVALPADDGSTIVAVGLGRRSELSPDTFRRAAAALVRAAWHSTDVATTLLAAAGPDTGVDVGEAARAVAEGTLLASHRFDRYKSEAKACKIQRLTLAGRATARKGIDKGTIVGTAVTLARDLVNEPAASLTPRRLAEVATEIANETGLGIRIVDEAEAAELGLGGLLGVARGSDEPPRLIELTYDPPGARGSIALVGKGITFDSGGLSIKTADGMKTMKTDKSGAAAVIAALSTMPKLAPKVKVIGLMPVTENMLGGRATKPGDVLRIRNGKTVEVLNTDAEGRLVLADALSLAVEAEVDAIVDVATLTGACVVALGGKIAGLMGNHQGWIDHVRAAADRAGEPVWHLPLPEEYRKALDSDVADIKNVTYGRDAPALAAGLFLREFVDTVPWAHLDIAGPARSDEDEGYFAKGGTGFGVRTLVETVTGFRKPSPPRA